MASGGPNSNPIISQALTWRKITPLHKAIGAQSIRFSPLILTANAPLTLFNSPFGPGTIDRIIGAAINLGGVGAGNIVLAELNCGWVWSISAGGHFGNYGVNMETLVDGANITLVSSINITAAMNAYLALYNFEIPTYSQGHSG